MREDKQRRTDYERGRAELVARFRVLDWSDLPEVRPMKFRSNEETLAEWAEQARAIEAHEHQLNLIAGREIAQQMKEEGKL